MARRRQYLYKQKKYGRVSKYGITNDPARRYGENARAGYGNKMEILGWSYSRRAAKRAESNKIRSYAQPIWQEAMGQQELVGKQGGQCATQKGL